MDVAELGMKVDTRPLKEAERSMEGFVRAGKRVDGAARNVTRQTDMMGAALKRAAKFAIAATSAFVGLGAATQAITTARQFNSALAETSTLLKGTAKEMSFLDKESKRLAGTYGGSATAQVKAFYQAISAGAGSVEQAATVLDQANRLAVGGVTDITTAVDGLTTATNAYAAQGLTAAEASDAMFVAMAAGKTTVGELSSQLGQIVPIASAAGVSFDEVVGGIAALTTQGQSTAMATTGLRQVIASIIKPTKQASDMAEQLGIAFNVQALESEGLAGFLEEVIEKTGGNQEAMAQLFGSVEALNAALAFAGGAGSTFSEILEDMANKAGATDAAFQKVAQELDQRMSAALGKIGNLGLVIGQALLKLVVPPLEAIAAAAQLLAENFDRVESYAIAAAAALTVTMAPALLAAGVAAGKFAAGILLTRTALIRSGWGVAIVLLGEVIHQISKAVEAAGGFGAALSLLGEVAAEVWERIKTGAAGMVKTMGGLWQSMSSSFLLALSEMATAAHDFLWRIGSAFSGVAGFETVGAGLLGAAEKLSEASGSLARSGYEARDAAKASHAAAKELYAAATAPLKSLEKLNKQVEETTEAAEDATSTTVDLDNALTDLGEGGAGKAGKGLKKAADEAKGFESALKDAAMTAEEIGKEKANILVAGIDNVANAFGDFVAGGLKDFKGFVKQVLSSFTGMISKMIALAARNRIMLSMGISASDLSGAAAQAAGGIPGLGGGGGLLGGILGSVASGTGLIGGASNVIASFGMSGVGGALSSISHSFSALAAGTGSLATAIGSALPVVGLAVAAFSFFKSKTKELDTGLRITATGMDALIESFRTVEKTRFWGLSKKVRTSYEAASSEVAQPIQDAINDIGQSITGLAGTLGLQAENLSNARYQFEISTKGKTEEEIQKAITEEMGELANAFSGALVGTYEELVVDAADIAAAKKKLDQMRERMAHQGGEGFELGSALRPYEQALADAEAGKVVERVNEEFARFVRSGEDYYDTLVALAGSLEIVNDQFDMLGFNLFDASLAGADMARTFTDLFGGWEGFANGVAGYIDAFYSDAEKLELITKRVSEGLEGLTGDNLNTAMESRDLFKALTDWAGSIAANSDYHRDMFAKLINVAPLVDEMFRLQDSLEQAGDATGGVTDQIEQLTEAQREAQGLLGQIDQLERQLLELQGDTVALRQREKDAVEDENVALVESIHTLQDKIKTIRDEQAAEAEAARAAEQMAGIEARLHEQLLRLQGDTVALRELEAEGLSETAKATLEKIWALEDEAAANDAAAEAADAAAQAAQELADQFDSFADAFFTDAEKLDLTTAKITDALSEVGTDVLDTVLSTRAGFKDLVLSLKEAGDPLYELLLSVSPLVANLYDLKDAIAEAGQVVDETGEVIEENTEALQQRQTLEDRLANTIQQINELTLTSEQLRALERSTIDATNLALYDQVTAREDELEAIIASQRAIEEAEQAAQERENKRLSEIERLTQRKLELEGDTEALRKLELATLEPSNRALQEYIWALEDQATAQEEASRIAEKAASEQDSLNRRILELQGDTAALRALELAELEPGNRALQERVWALEDEAEAIAEANRLKAEELAERLGLEGELLRLQGNTAELRRRELEALFPANRELQERIWALQDVSTAEEAAAEATANAAARMQDALSHLATLIDDAITAIRERAAREISDLRATLEAAQSAFDLTRTQLEGAYATVQASVDADRVMAVARYETALSRLDSRMDHARASASRLGSIFSMLDSAFNSASEASGSALAAQVREAQRFLIGQRGRVPADADRLQSALSLAGKDSTTFYRDAESFRNAQLKTAAAIGAMRRNAEGELTEAERQVEALEAARVARERQHEREMDALDAQLARAKEIYEAALGNTVAVLEVNASIDNLRQVANGFITEQLALNRLTEETNATIAEIERLADMEIDFLSAQLAESRTAVQVAERTYNATLSVEDAIADLSDAIEAYMASQNPEDPPAFATGGVHGGGPARIAETGVEIVAPSRIYNPSQTRAMLDNRVLAVELQRLRQEVRDLRNDSNARQERLIVTAEKSRKISDKWDKEGLPTERTT
jgi:TP901 family phage tail tape measure protein